MRFGIAWGLATTATALLCLAALDHNSKADEATDRVQPISSTAEPLPGEFGMRVAIDPETGELGMPSDEQHKAMDEGLQQMLSRSSEGLVPQVQPDGSVKVNLQGRFQSVSIATIGGDGKLHTTCIENDAALPAGLGVDNLGNAAACDHSAHAAAKAEVK